MLEVGDMLVRVLIAVSGVAIGLALAATLPQVGQTARTIVSHSPLARLAQLNAQDASRAKRPQREDDTRPRGSTDELAASKRGILKLSDEQIAASRIETAKVSDGALTRRLTVPGTVVLAADRVGRVAAKVVGTVAELRKQLGDPVTRGEVVAVLDSREVADAKSEHLAASVNFDLQKALFEREQSLFQKNITAEQQFLRARATYSQAQLRIDLARQKLYALGVTEEEIAGLSRESTGLQRYELRATISGRIVERLVSLGAPVGSEGLPHELYGIADLSRVWVELAVRLQDLDSVSEGDTVKITAGAGGRPADGKIIFKSPMLNADTRSARVVAQLSNDAGLWQPAAFVTAEIIVDSQKVPLVVPKSALQTLGKDQIVFVRTSEGFEKREVTAGRKDGQLVEIVSGLQPGEEIAVANTFTLKAELGKSELSDED